MLCAESALPSLDLSLDGGEVVHWNLGWRWKRTERVPSRVTSHFRTLADSELCALLHSRQHLLYLAFSPPSSKSRMAYAPYYPPAPWGPQQYDPRLRAGWTGWADTPPADIDDSEVGDQPVVDLFPDPEGGMPSFAPPPKMIEPARSPLKQHTPHQQPKYAHDHLFWGSPAGPPAPAMNDPMLYNLAVETWPPDIQSHWAEIQADPTVPSSLAPAFTPAHKMGAAAKQSISYEPNEPAYYPPPMQLALPAPPMGMGMGMGGGGGLPPLMPADIGYPPGMDMALVLAPPPPPEPKPFPNYVNNINRPSLPLPPRPPSAPPAMSPAPPPQPIAQIAYGKSPSAKSATFGKSPAVHAMPMYGAKTTPMHSAKATPMHSAKATPMHSAKGTPAHSAKATPASATMQIPPGAHPGPFFYTAAVSGDDTAATKENHPQQQHQQRKEPKHKSPDTKPLKSALSRVPFQDPVDQRLGKGPAWDHVSALDETDPTGRMWAHMGVYPPVEARPKTPEVRKGRKRNASFSGMPTHVAFAQQPGAPYISPVSRNTRFFLFLNVLLMCYAFNSVLFNSRWDAAT